MPVNDIQFLGHVFRAYGTGGVVPRCAKIRRLLAEQVERLAPNAFARDGYAIAPAGSRRDLDMIACCACGDQPICNAADYRLGGRSVRVVLAKCERCRVIRWDAREYPREGCEGVRTVAVGNAIDGALRMAAERRAAPQGVRDDLVIALRRRAANIMAGMPPSGSLAAARVRPAVEPLHRRHGAVRRATARRPEPRNLGY